MLADLRRLPRHEREVMVLAVWEGLSHADIATATGTAVGTVKSRLSRACARLERNDRSLIAHPNRQGAH